jgi:glycosyltransferase involved in cell wall biosynthesis
MPVFNGEKTLSAAIESILCQSYSNFELIIINDGSQDQSVEVVKQFSDKRIKLFTQTNGGLAKALNIGIFHSTGDLIARQDQDDISMPYRIEKQVERFSKNSALVLLGTWGRIIDDQGNILGKMRMPTRNLDLQYLVNFYNPFIHTSVMMKVAALEQIGGYSEDLEKQPPEDFELWSRIKVLGQIENLNKYLVDYRLSVNSMSRKYEEIIAINYKNIVVANLRELLNFSEAEAIVFFDLQFLKQNRYKYLVRLHLLYKFMLGFNKTQVRFQIFGLPVYINNLKAIIRIFLK